MPQTSPFGYYREVGVIRDTTVTRLGQGALLRGRT